MACIRKLNCRHAMKGAQIELSGGLLIWAGMVNTYNKAFTLSLIMAGYDLPIEQQFEVKYELVLGSLNYNHELYQAKISFLFKFI